MIDNRIMGDRDKMPWGKYEGTTMEKVPVDYLNWLWHNGKRENFTCPVAMYIRHNLKALKSENEDLIW